MTEPTQADMVAAAMKKYDVLNAQVDMIKAATIERCAQVLDEHANLSSGMAQGAYRNGAAAIRKLKDETS